MGAVEHLLRDTVVVRPIAAGDEPRVRTFLTGLDGDSAMLRLFGAGEVRVAAWRACRPPTVDSGSVVVERDGEIVALGALARLYGPRAEVALEIAPVWRHDGLAPRMLAQLERPGVRGSGRGRSLCRWHRQGRGRCHGRRDAAKLPSN